MIGGCGAALSTNGLTSVICGYFPLLVTDLVFLWSAVVIFIVRITTSTDLSQQCIIKARCRLLPQFTEEEKKRIWDSTGVSGVFSYLSCAACGDDLF